MYAYYLYTTKRTKAEISIFLGLGAHLLNKLLGAIY